jgi:hypothetical protein
VDPDKQSLLIDSIAGSTIHVKDQVGFYPVNEMRYLVTARVKPGKELALLDAIENGTIGAGSVAGDEYLRNMEQARLCHNGAARWVEVCFCSLPLEEERPYWEEYFDVLKIQDAHGRHRCRDRNGTEPWACSDCDCTQRLETRMRQWGTAFLESLREAVANFETPSTTKQP